MNKLVGFTLTALSFSALAKLPDPLWTPQGGNYQQQFGSPISHENPVIEQLPMMECKNLPHHLLT